VLITGASRGIGAQIALQYARAGALLSLVARTQAALDASKDAILREHPSAQVLTFPADVRDVKRAEEVVAATVARLGRLDIVVANAGALRSMDNRTFGAPTRIITTLVASWLVSPLQVFASKDPNGWWEVLEVNIRGPYNFIQCAIFIYPLFRAKCLSSVA
jgi:NAD(P)-dependent dehydrogenase (short-subunit alcohol dehydrogenase family)